MSLLLIAAAYLYNQIPQQGLLAPAPTAGSNNKEVVSEAHPRFVDLGTFSNHLGGEESGQSLKASLSLKLTHPGLEKKVTASLPEIQHHVNMVLQSKLPSELSTYEDKERLAQQLKQHVEYVMGFRKTTPAIGSTWVDDVPTIKDNGISAVLFTAFLIQH